MEISLKFLSKFFENINTIRSACTNIFLRNFRVIQGNLQSSNRICSDFMINVVQRTLTQLTSATLGNRK